MAAIEKPSKLNITLNNATDIRFWWNLYQNICLFDCPSHWNKNNGCTTSGFAFIQDERQIEWLWNVQIPYISSVFVFCMSLFRKTHILPIKKIFVHLIYKYETIKYLKKIRIQDGCRYIEFEENALFSTLATFFSFSLFR